MKLGFHIYIYIYVYKHHNIFSPYPIISSTFLPFSHPQRSTNIASAQQHQHHTASAHGQKD